MEATMYLLDTNVLSEILRPRPDAGVIGTLLGKPGHALFASELTRFELRRGACLRKDPAPLWKAISEQILPLVQWLPVDAPISLRAGELSAALRRRGIEIGIVDTLLAATAQSRGLVVVTRNQRHFEPIPDLVVESWFGAG